MKKIEGKEAAAKEYSKATPDDKTSFGTKKRAFCAGWNAAVSHITESEPVCPECECAGVVMTMGRYTDCADCNGTGTKPEVSVVGDYCECGSRLIHKSNSAILVCGACGKKYSRKAVSKCPPS